MTFQRTTNLVTSKYVNDAAIKSGTAIKEVNNSPRGKKKRDPTTSANPTTTRMFEIRCLLAFPALLMFDLKQTFSEDDDSKGFEERRIIITLCNVNNKQLFLSKPRALKIRKSFNLVLNMFLIGVKSGGGWRPVHELRHFARKSDVQQRTANDAKNNCKRKSSIVLDSTISSSILHHTHNRSNIRAIGHSGLPSQPGLRSFLIETLLKFFHSHICYLVRHIVLNWQTGVC
jgi:hypothetical protein